MGLVLCFLLVLGVFGVLWGISIAFTRDTGRWFKLVTHPVERGPMRDGETIERVDIRPTSVRVMVLLNYCLALATILFFVPIGLVGAAVLRHGGIRLVALVALGLCMSVGIFAFARPFVERRLSRDKATLMGAFTICHHAVVLFVCMSNQELWSVRDSRWMVWMPVSIGVLLALWWVIEALRWLPPVDLPASPKPHSQEPWPG